MDYGYIAYIDEAGDPGLTKVRPIDENGASEWLILSAVVMKAQREANVVDWIDKIRTDIGVTQRRFLHFRDLSPTRKMAVSNAIAGLPLRAFAICSNKKNMRGYENRKADKIPSQQWFYNWCIRLLLERVTAFCESRTMKDYGEHKLVKIEFSRRGGHHYSQTRAYQYYLGFQQEGDKIYLQKRQPVTKMLHTDLMEDHPHYSRAGLQLADAVASAFYQASDFLGLGTWDAAPSKALQPIMAKENGSARDFGVALFPTPAWKAELLAEQKDVFLHYGYDFSRW
ncbi:DUF3800 domain-containing protein [Sphingomonas fennica]|uniref:DUF3800 domain-containing protein n=1 Tax=Edaphosphingomonas fennica TaxID=114404 RepID=A0A2T4HR28_9SPHN|nr:DUF3800 domain-containing protein [Sphingomonas fennica]PTD18271.1 DUF3800 domain-containing protein [Sphingomonas fennica]